MSDVKDVDLARHPSPPFDSLPYPTRTIRRRVRTYVRSVNHVTSKGKEVDHNLWVWGSVSRVLCVRGSPATICVHFLVYSALFFLWSITVSMPLKAKRNTRSLAEEKDFWLLCKEKAIADLRDKCVTSGASRHF